MDLQKLAAAYLALSPAPASLVAGCAALNAQTTPSVAIDVPATWVRDVLAQTGEWGALMVAIDPGTTASAQIRAVIHNLKTLVDTDATFKTSRPAIQQDVTASLSALQSAGLIASTTVATCQALWVGPAQPAWRETIIPAHLQMCQNAGLLSHSIPVS